MWLISYHGKVFGCAPYEKQRQEKIDLTKRSEHGAYDDQETLKGRRFVPETY